MGLESTVLDNYAAGAAALQRQRPRKQKAPAPSLLRAPKADAEQLTGMKQQRVSDLG
jgi:hypothetical protein